MSLSFGVELEGLAGVAADSLSESSEAELDDDDDDEEDELDGAAPIALRPLSLSCNDNSNRK